GRVDACATVGRPVAALKIQVELARGRLRIEIAIQFGHHLAGQIDFALLSWESNEHSAIFRFAIGLNRGVGQIGAKAVQGHLIAELQHDVRTAGELDAPVDALFQKQTGADEDPDQRKHHRVEAVFNEIVIRVDKNLHVKSSSY